VEPEGSLPHLQEPATCPYPEPPQLGSYQRISRGPRFCRLFRNMLCFYSEELLAPRPTNLEDHPLSAVRYWLFNVFAATLRNWTPFLHPEPEEAPRRGDRDLLNTADDDNKDNNILCTYIYIFIARPLVHFVVLARQQIYQLKVLPHLVTRL
jgi:hypothetical protein